MQPGDSGKIPVKISTKHGNGPVSKSIVVNTNIAGTDAQITLQLKGEIWQAVQVTPNSAAFGRITSTDAEKGASRKLTVVNNVEGELKLSEPKSSNPKFKADLVSVENGKKYELTVTLVPPLVPGNNNGNIEIETGVAELPKLTVPVYAFITSSVDVTPTALSIPPVRTAELTRQFYVRSNVNKAVKLSNLACTNPDLKLDLQDVKDSMTYRLSVVIPPTYKPPTGGDKITFNTDDSSVPVITIPINEITPVRPMPTAVKPGATPPRSPAFTNRPTSNQPATGTTPAGSHQPAANQKPASATREQPATGDQKGASAAAPAKTGEKTDGAKPAGN